MFRPLLVAVLLAPSAALAQATPAAASPPVQGLADLLAQADAAYARRDEPGALDAIREKLGEAERLAPGDYEVLWRQARLQFWISDDPELADKEKSRVGKTGWELAERAIEKDPSRVEGWHHAAAGMGNYSLGIGILKALAQGIEGKFKDRLSHAEKIEPGYEGGAIYTAWGRFWFKLPWPKYDERKSRLNLEEALRRNPDNVRARVYLADLHLEEDRPAEARAELEKAIANPPGRYDAPEERRWQAVARRMLAKK